MRERGEEVSGGARRRASARARAHKAASRSSFLCERKAVEEKRRSVTTPPEGAAARSARRADRRARVTHAVGGAILSAWRCSFPSEAVTYRASSWSWSSGRRERPCAMKERADETNGKPGSYARCARDGGTRKRSASALSQATAYREHVGNVQTVSSLRNASPRATRRVRGEASSRNGDGYSLSGFRFLVLARRARGARLDLLTRVRA